MQSFSSSKAGRADDGSGGATFEDAAESQGSTGAGIAALQQPSEQFQDEAFTYVGRWCASAREFTQRKVQRWKLLEDLYHNRRQLNSWGERSISNEASNRSGLVKRAPAERDRWQADIVLAPAYIVDTWADKAYQAIFNGPDWLTVVPENPQGPTTEDLQFPTLYKLQELLLARLSEGQIHVRLYEILQHLVLYGTVFAKIFWHSRRCHETAGTTKRSK